MNNECNSRYYHCSELLAMYIQLRDKREQGIPIDTEEEEVALQNLLQALSKYGDIYKKLKMKPYVNPTTKKLLFPNNQRIYSNYNLFLKSQDVDNFDDEKVELFNIMFNIQLRRFYNSTYRSVADKSSLEEDDRGIVALMNKGGKTRRKKIRRSKTRKYKKLN